MVLRTIVWLLTLAVALTASPATAGAPTASAAMAVTAGPLSFSRGLTEAGEQTLPETDFPTNIVTVWATFDFEGYTSATHLNAVVRANRRDFKTIDLACCPSASGSVSFPIARDSGRVLGGAAWEVIVYVGDTEVTRGGFGVRGTRGFEDDDE
jgi:hypothetical protein